LIIADTSAGESFKKPGDLKPREIVAGLLTNKLGLRNVLGNVREWTTKGVPFGNSYAWGKSLSHDVTLEQRTTGEQIGMRLICEPRN
jgi:formylglycine-generating enzyme required for sulfatase activity